MQLCGEKRRNPQTNSTHEQIVNRFWEKVRRGSGEECWIWIGARQLSGYGVMFLQRKSPRWLIAHRFSYELEHGIGSIPETMVGEAGVQGETCVCHHCDTPACVNPAHLFLGTRSDNNVDRGRKGRTSDQRGTMNDNATLEEEDITKIFALRAEGWTQQAIADMFGVQQPLISRILRHKLWKHIETYTIK